MSAIAKRYDRPDGTERSKGVEAARSPVVSVRGLRKVYRAKTKTSAGEVVAVDDVDLTVGQGELVVLLGPSGCGKTTLLRSIAGLETPSSGEIEIGGSHVYSARSRINLPPEARRIGMMFQSYALWPHMTVFANIAYPLKEKSGYGREEVESRVAELLGRLGIQGLEKRYPGELSGGQAQRVALARALSASPSILLFDEPLSNVDAKVRRRLRAELREVKQLTGFAGVYVTHDQEEAMELADRLAVMENGNIRQIGSPRDVYTRPASIYVASFVGEINKWPATAKSAEGSGILVESELGQVALRATSATPAPGQRGWLTIRPERIRLEEARSNDESALVGCVTDVVFLGSRYELRVRLNGGTDVLACITDDGRTELLPARGDKVRIAFEGEGLQWLPE